MHYFPRRKKDIQKKISEFDRSSSLLLHRQFSGKAEKFCLKGSLVRALAGSLCCVLEQYAAVTLTMPLFTREYKTAVTKRQEKLERIAVWRVTRDRLISRPRGLTIPVVS